MTANIIPYLSILSNILCSLIPHQTLRNYYFQPYNDGHLKGYTLQCCPTGTLFYLRYCRCLSYWEELEMKSKWASVRPRSKVTNSNTLLSKVNYINRAPSQMTEPIYLRHMTEPNYRRQMKYTTPFLIPDTYKKLVKNHQKYQKSFGNQNRNPFFALASIDPVFNLDKHQINFVHNNIDDKLVGTRKPNYLRAVQRSLQSVIDSDANYRKNYPIQKEVLSQNGLNTKSHLEYSNPIKHIEDIEDLPYNIATQNMDSILKTNFIHEKGKVLTDMFKMNLDTTVHGNNSFHKRIMTGSESMVSAGSNSLFANNNVIESVATSDSVLNGGSDEALVDKELTTVVTFPNTIVDGQNVGDRHTIINGDSKAIIETSHIQNEGTRNKGDGAKSQQTDISIDKNIFDSNTQFDSLKSGFQNNDIAIPLGVKDLQQLSNITSDSNDWTLAKGILQTIQDFVDKTNRHAGMVHLQSGSRLRNDLLKGQKTMNNIGILDIANNIRNGVLSTYDVTGLKIHDNGLHNQLNGFEPVGITGGSDLIDVSQLINLENEKLLRQGLSKIIPFSNTALINLITSGFMPVAIGIGTDHGAERSNPSVIKDGNILTKLSEFVITDTIKNSGAEMKFVPEKNNSGLDYKAGNKTVTTVHVPEKNNSGLDNKAGNKTVPVVHVPEKNNSGLDNKADNKTVPVVHVPEKNNSGLDYTNLIIADNETVTMVSLIKNTLPDIIPMQTTLPVSVLNQHPDVDKTTNPNSINFIEILPTDICQGCKMDGGIGYTNHPTFCDRFVICYPTEGGSIQPRTQLCSYGLFWSQSALTCKLTKDVYCPHEVCKSQKDKYEYASKRTCRSYWECQGGVSVPRCCPWGHSYLDGRGCVKDPTCLIPDVACSSDTNNYTIEWGGVCDKRPILGKNMLYERKSDGKWIEHACPNGWIYKVELCECTKMIESPPYYSFEGHKCVPEIYLPFSDDFSDHSGNNVYVQIENVSLTSGAACFHGKSVLSIPAFANMDYGANFYIHIRYKQMDSSTSIQSLVFNGDCDRMPTLMLGTTPSGNYFSFLSNINEEKKMWVLTKRLLTDWRDVWLKLKNGKIILQSNDYTEYSNLRGGIARSECGMKLGWGRGFENFIGCMDEVSIYRCQPE